jgi:hypothetical protein
LGKAKSINLTELVKDEEKFYTKLEKLITSALKNENYKKRRNKLMFTFNKKTYECSVANFITQMIFMIPFVDTQVECDDNSFIILDEIQDFNANHYIKWANDIINYFDGRGLLEDEEILNKLNIGIKKNLKYLADLSGSCNIQSGTTINIYDLLKLYSENEEFRDLVNLEIPDGEFSDIEKNVNKQFKDVMDILREEDTCYKPYFRSKTGINEKQFKEIISSIGLKSDLDGTIIPYIIQANYFRGLSNLIEFYIIAILARKALITSHKKVKDSGYLTRKISMLLIDTMLSDDVDDCETDEYVPVEITDEETASRYDLRYFLNDDDELECFNSEYHKELIGKTLQFRSPIKCKCSDGRVCHTCYGDLYRVNKNIHIGIEATLELTEQLTQKLLSAKHLQQTFSEIINWVKEFNKNFIVDKNYVYVNPDKEKSGSSLVFDEDSMSEPDEENRIAVSSFIIKSKNGNEVEVPLPDNVTLYFTDSAEETILSNPFRDANSRIIVAFKSLLEDESPVFQFSMKNNELSSSLNAIVNIIESANHPDPDEKDEKGKPVSIDDIDILTNKFIKLLNNGGIHLSAVHAELILRALVRSKKDHTIRPERFDNKDDENEGYDILKVSDAIIESPSSSVSLSFEQIKKQLQSPELYKKHGTSILDILYFQ